LCSCSPWRDMGPRWLRIGCCLCSTHWCLSKGLACHAKVGRIRLWKCFRKLSSFLRLNVLIRCSLLERTDALGC
jgi:hypothetical protein